MIKFKTLLNKYHNNKLSLIDILSYIHQKNLTKAYHKFSENNFQFNNLYCYSLSNKKYFIHRDVLNPDQIILKYLLWLQQFKLNMQNISLYSITYIIKNKNSNALLDYYLENNLLIFDWSKDSNVERLKFLSLDYFKKFVFYYDLDIHAYYGKNKLNLYHYIKDNGEIIFYLYLENVDIYHNLNKCQINTYLIRQFFDQYDLYKINDEAVYHLINLVDVFKLMDIIYRILDNKKQDYNYHNLILSKYFRYPEIKIILERYVEENIPIEIILLDFVDILCDVSSIQKNYLMLENIYQLFLKNMVITMKNFEKYSRYYENSVNPTHKKLDVFYNIGYILYLVENEYISEYLSDYIKFYLVLKNSNKIYYKKEENFENLENEELEEKYKKWIINGYRECRDARKLLKYI